MRNGDSEILTQRVPFSSTLRQAYFADCTTTKNAQKAEENQGVDLSTTAQVLTPQQDVNNLKPSKQQNNAASAK